MAGRRGRRTPPGPLKTPELVVDVRRPAQGKGKVVIRGQSTQFAQLGAANRGLPPRDGALDLNSSIDAGRPAFFEPLHPSRRESFRSCWHRERSTSTRSLKRLLKFSSDRRDHGVIEEERIWLVRAEVLEVVQQSGAVGSWQNGFSNLSSKRVAVAHSFC